MPHTVADSFVDSMEVVSVALKSSWVSLEEDEGKGHQSRQKRRPWVQQKLKLQGAEARANSVPGASRGNLTLATLRFNPLLPPALCYTVLHIPATWSVALCLTTLAHRVQPKTLLAG